MNTTTTSKLPNTLFNRMNFLKVNIEKFNMKNVGQLIRKAYTAKTGKQPEKLSFMVDNAAGKPTKRDIAVYPDHFVDELDQIIINYAQANKPKRKRINRQRVGSSSSQGRQKR